VRRLEKESRSLAQPAEKIVFAPREMRWVEALLPPGEEEFAPDFLSLSRTDA